MSASAPSITEHATSGRAPGHGLKVGPATPLAASMSCGRAWLLLAVTTAIAFTAGCGRPAPTLAHIEAKNFGTFYAWRSTVSSQFTPEQWRDFKVAIQELRLSAMAHGVTTTAAIDAALCARIDGHSVNDVILLADAARLERLGTARARLKTMVDANALLAPNPGDAEIAAMLDRRRNDQEDRLHKLTLEIEDARKQLVAHGGTAPAALLINQAAAVLSRDEALHEFARLLQARRALSIERYGDWPARIDRSGADLAGFDRDEFQQKRRAAEINGHVVVPVYVRASWRIFDAPVTFPDFSTAVTGNLTPDDRRRIEMEWADSEAEIWARKKASLDTPDHAIANIKADLQGVMRP